MSGTVEDKCVNFKSHVKDMESTVKNLEEAIKEINHCDNQMMRSRQNEKMKYQGLSNQLEEALKENKHLMNILQQNSGTQDVSRTNSQVDLSSSCSTMSIVHLQYKYEELLTNHHGLLKLLEMKTDEIKKVHTENSTLKSDMEEIKRNVKTSSQKIKKIHQKMIKMREKKDSKIRKLKTYKETLQLAHSQLVNLLHNQFIEKDDTFLKEIKLCKNSHKTLLLQEIRKNNMLRYENIQLHQKVEFLTALLEAERKINKSQSKTTCTTAKKNL